ncbi:Diguanylate cyclase/phosphodiesterase [Mycoavidus cysteinexigens]|uniref:Diguanylate cyclase/phosphodiesterase n=1 Tax=Mycoavidus cysteinexigens TaxID=1553431 RepID=A0A2Z6EVB8_9BURK|nr:hypothetical protein [Mycoavidus cysteinexigens]BBE09413.1 Diguanylate cyclase/phosphodiesterase [Mycoavidus cysteinexigens]GLR01632.1 hypothetical protein GCM10007934_14440 [Mycoavidus cysteinexigens]
MDSVLLNMGCGYLPLVPDDLNFNGKNIFDYVINYDPLYLVSKEGEENSRILNDIDFITYFNAVERGKAQFTQYPTEIHHEIVDVILAISPFGFRVINEWSHNLLTRGGFVIRIGSVSNPYLNERKLFDDSITIESGLQGEYTLLEQDYNLPRIIKFIIARVKDKYVSNKTGLVQAEKTLLNLSRVARKGSLIDSYNVGLVGDDNGIVQ